MTAAKLNRSTMLGQLSLFLLLLYGCTSSVEMVSQVDVENKISRIRIGQSDKNEVQNTLGPQPGNDRHRWVYNFDDKQFEISERRQGTAVGMMPFTAGTVPVNTRAVVAVTFDPAGIVKRVEVARFFEEPFVNDYWYLIKNPAKEPLESIAKIGESVGFKVVGLNKSTGVFSLEDPSSKANILVKLDDQILRVTTKNPHHRLANEYRSYGKRESAFTNAIVDSELVQ